MCLKLRWPQHHVLFRPEHVLVTTGSRKHVSGPLRKWKITVKSPMSRRVEVDGAPTMMDSRIQRSICSPIAWYNSLQSGPGHINARGRDSLRRFNATSGKLSQPPLNAHLIAQHLGGPKRVHRTQGRRNWVQDVQLGSITLMPAYQPNQWHTVGPIDFAHLILEVGALERIVIEEFDSEPAAHRLNDTIGLIDPLLEQVFQALLADAEGEAPSRLRHEALLTVLSVTLLERYSTLSGRRPPECHLRQVRGGLAGWQLRRVTDYMQAHMDENVSLGGLAALAGLSRAHFFRAFRQSIGLSPGEYLAEKRMKHARTMLETSSLPLDEIATALGFCHVRHFATAFTKRIGMSPRLYRASQLKPGSSI